MPELPEVETVRRDLYRLVAGATVTRVRVLCPGMLRGGTPAALQRSLRGATIVQVARRGKVLILRFSSGWSLLVHFRMTGQLYPVGVGEPLPAHTRTVLELADGRRLAHVDVRKLGTVELVRTDCESAAVSLAAVGRDALCDPPTPQGLEQLLARRRCPIKAFLLDQRALAGIGNIYASEILARAGIAPDTPCHGLTAAQIRALLVAMRQVLTAAVQAGGTTISNYRTGAGTVGGYQTQLRVYGRHGKACRKRGCPGVVERMVQGQRSTFVCPVCQARSADTD